MSEDNQRNIESATMGIKSVISTLMPFISFAFMLMAFIYTRDAADSKEVLNQILAEQAKQKEYAADVRNTLTERLERLKRLEEIAADNKATIETLKQRQTDLEKTYILSNANRR